jgi:glycosyltransferase involved in cell wall biosynthesis
MPDTCLLIATMNRSDLLEKSLNRMNQLTLPDEILIVDDGGVDHCREVAERVVMECPVRYIYTHNPGQSQCSHARNVGIKNTDCDLIITSEPEMLFVSDVVAQLLVRFEEYGRKDVISAGTINHEHSRGHIGDTTRGWVATWIALYGKQWLLDIGGWDEWFPDPWGWEDTDLLTRLRCDGHGQFIDQEIEATHQWHVHRAVNQERNEAHFRAKLLPLDGSEIKPLDIIANHGHPWGEIKS